MTSHADLIVTDAYVFTRGCRAFSASSHRCSRRIHLARCDFPSGRVSRIAAGGGDEDCRILARLLARSAGALHQEPDRTAKTGKSRIRVPAEVREPARQWTQRLANCAVTPRIRQRRLLRPPRPQTRPRRSSSASAMTAAGYPNCKSSCLSSVTAGRTDRNAEGKSTKKPFAACQDCFTANHDGNGRETW